MTDEAIDEPLHPAPEWPLRPWLLAGLLGLAALLFHWLTGERFQVPWRAAAAAFIGFGAVAAAFTLDRDRWREPALFALGVGAVMAGLAWRAVAAGDHYADQGYGFAAAVLASALALPLFQAGFHRRRFATPYAAFHGHVWTDAISGGGAAAFTGLSWLLLVVVAELFGLLKIHALKDLMDKGWFDAAFSGLAFGAALGTIGNERRLLGTLRTIVLMVLSLLAVPFAVALALFLLAMAASGPGVLWQATRSATPVLLTCAAGAFVLANTILRQDDAEMPRNRVLRFAALLLALTILPLTGFAAASMGTRIAQHGLSPERIWAMMAIAIACACALAYAVAVIRGWRGAWRGGLRNTNLALAAGVCALALVLALPIFDFGAISAASQVRRLEAGKVTPERFDYTALRWDFGDAGRRALARLATGGNARIAEFARSASGQTARPSPYVEIANKARAEFNLRVQPNDPALRDLVLDYLSAHPQLCVERCVALDIAGAPLQGGMRRVAIVNDDTSTLVLLAPGGAGTEPAPTATPSPKLDAGSSVEVRKWSGYRIYVDGKATGEPFE